MPVLAIALAVALFRPGSGPDPQQRVADYVDSYDRGGDCFFITPETVGRDAATIDALGREGGDASLAPFQALSTAFESANGFEATIQVRQVTAAQCPAVDFLFQTRRQRNAAPQLDVAAARLEDGKLLVAGSVSRTVDAGPADGIAGLLLVPDDGYVYNLAGLLRANGATQTFEQKIEKRKPGRIPQLLIVVASPQPLNALRLPDGGSPAEELFPRALAEAARTGQPLHVRAKYFMLEE
jgi:serine/threonine-protein kinase